MLIQLRFHLFNSTPTAGVSEYKHLRDALTQEEPYIGVNRKTNASDAPFPQLVYHALNAPKLGNWTYFEMKLERVAGALKLGPDPSVEISSDLHFCRFHQIHKVEVGLHSRVDGDTAQTRHTHT